MTPTEKDFQMLANSKTLEFIFEDLRVIYAAMWADSQDKKEREYLWFKQAAILEIKAAIIKAGTE